MKWVQRLRHNFGSPFLFLIASVYWTQGFRSLPWMAISYQLKDELKLNPSASQFVTTVAFLPWSIKPIYGIFSDCIPINGSRRISYLIVSSILCLVPWLSLGLLEYLRMSWTCMTGLLTIQNLGAAMADVVIDAMIAEAARKERSEFAGDLQSMSWFSMALGGMFGSLIGGYALSALGVNGIFLMFSLLPLLQLVACGLTDEKELMGMHIETSNEKNDTVEYLQNAGGIEHCKRTLVDSEHLHNRNAKPKEEVAIQTPGKEKTRNAEIPLSSRLTNTLYMLFETLRKPVIRRPMLWFFLAQVCVPNLATIMFYYQTNRLHLDASFLGTSRFIGWMALMLGTFIYNRFLKNVQLRKIFGWTHFAMAIITLSDVVLVSGLNVKLGIPNSAFIIGASAMGDAVQQFKLMPFLVISGRLCEEGIEGTLFALFMSLNNFGNTLSSFLGAMLASVLHISSEDFSNFAIGICVQAGCTLLPILFLHLIPVSDSHISTAKVD